MAASPRNEFNVSFGSLHLPGNDSNVNFGSLNLPGNESKASFGFLHLPGNESNVSFGSLHPGPIDVIMAEFYPVAFQLNRILPFICYVVGFIGNTLSAVAWLQPRLSKLNSSAVYLALLSISDLLFLVLHCTSRLDVLLDARLAAHAWFCEIFHFVFFVPQYLNPLLVLGFTAERYVAICHPLLRRLLCRTRTAVSASIGMTIGAVFLSSVQPVFWTYSHKMGYCALRRSIPGIESLWFVLTLVAEILMFLIVPMATLVLDVLVIRCLGQINKNTLNFVRSRGVSTRVNQNEAGGKAMGKNLGMRGRRGDGGAEKIGVALVEPFGNEAGPGVDVADDKLGGDGGKETGTENSGRVLVASCVEMKGARELERPRSSGIRVPYPATTVLILSVSLYEIATTVSVSVLYLLHDCFPRGSIELSIEEMLSDPTWQRYFPYRAANYIIMSLCMTRYAALLFFYLALGPRFRETLWDLVRFRNPPPRPELTRSTFAGSSVSSVRSQHRVEQMMKPRTST